MEFAKEFNIPSSKTDELSKRKDDGWGAVGGYMTAKIQKLDSQFLSTTSSEFSKKSDIFHGVSIWVNGYTQPSSDELKLLIKEHGGEYIHFFSKTKVTHVIASNITESKIKDLKRNDQVIHPSWITESVKARKRLATDKYLLHSVAKRDGTALKFKPTISKAPSTPADDTENDSKNTPLKVVATSTKAPSLSHHQYTAASTSFTAKAGDANFISEFYAHSRLHHLSMWKAELKKFASSIQAKRKKTREKRAMNCERLIMHIDLDSFFVAVAVKKNPSLKGKPIAVCHATGKKDTSSESWSEVASCSYESRSKGVKNGMFLHKAKELCPDIISVPYDFDEYRNVSQSFYEVLSTKTCNIEAVSCDEALVDISELIVNDDMTPKEVAEMFRSEILKRTGCVASCGIAANILLARMATRQAKPNGVYHVTEDMVKTFLLDKNVRDLPGTGRVQYQKLEAMNITTCGQLQSVRITTLQNEFGKKTGTSLYNYCRGIDERQLEYEHERKSVSAEINYGMRFTQELEVYKFIGELSTEVQKRLKEISKIGNKITFKIMVRSKGASKEAAKYMGHGICDSLSKSVMLPIPTDQAAIIEKNCVSMFRGLRIVAHDVRGMGIQINNLSDNNTAGKTTSIISFTKPIESVCEVNGSANAPQLPSLPSWERITEKKASSTKQTYIEENLQSVDENILQELPPDIQDEIRNQIKRQQTLAAVRPTIISPSKMKKSPGKHESPKVSPAKQSKASPGKKAGRGRPKKLVDANKYGDIRTVTQKKPSLFSNILLSPSQVDINTVKELPDFLQKEVLAAIESTAKSRNTYKLPRKADATTNFIDLTNDKKSSDSNVPLLPVPQINLPLVDGIRECSSGNELVNINNIKTPLNSDIRSKNKETENTKSSTYSTNTVQKETEIPFSPSQLDQSLFDALPKQLQDDVLRDMKVLKRRKEVETSRNLEIVVGKHKQQNKLSERNLSEVSVNESNSTAQAMFSQSQLDQSVLEALPEAIRHEVEKTVASMKRKQSVNPSMENLIEEMPEASEPNFLEVKRKVSLEQILPNLHGAKELITVKKLLRVWIDSCDDPLADDIDEVEKYFANLLSSHNMETLFILVRFLKRITMHSENWRATFNTILAHVQLLLKRNYNATFPIQAFAIT